MKNKFKISGDVLIIYNRTDNREIMCDATDFDLVSQHTWYLNNGYAVTNIKGTNGKYKHLSLHRLLMNAPAGTEVDHINGITHDNRKSNLRIVTTQENQHNHKAVKGYSWHKNAGKYYATIGLNNKTINLGSYNTADEARQAYLDAKRIYHPSAPVMSF